MSEQSFLEYSEVSELSFIQKMLDQFTGLSRDILIYGISGSLGQMFVLFTIPILTRALSVGDFGALDVIYAVIGYLLLIMTFNIGHGLWRYFYEVSPSDNESRQQMTSSLLWFILTVGLPIAILVSIFAPEISSYLFGGPDRALAIQFASLSMLVMAIYNVFIGIQRLKRRPFLFLAINLGYSLLYLILVVLLVSVRKTGLPGIFLAQLISYTIAAGITLWLARDLIALTFSQSWLRKMAAYGLPLLPASIMSWSLIAINRFFLNSYVGEVQLGYYSLAGKITVAMALVVSSFTLAWQPYMLSNLKNPESQKIYPVTLNYYAIITLLVAAGITVFAREIVLIVATPDYMPSVPIICILLFRYILPGSEQITGVGIVISKKTIFTSLALAAAVLANLIATSILTPRFGIVGAAFAETTGFFVGQVVIYILSTRLYPVQWDLKVVFLSLFGYVLVSFASIYMLGSQIPPGWYFSLRIGLLSLYILFLTRLIEPDQRNVLLKLPGQVYTRARARLTK